VGTFGFVRNVKRMAQLQGAGGAALGAGGASVGLGAEGQVEEAAPR
jgi:hypothetical protein